MAPGKMSSVSHLDTQNIRSGLKYSFETDIIAEIYCKMNTNWVVKKSTVLDRSLRIPLV